MADRPKRGAGRRFSLPSKSEVMRDVLRTVDAKSPDELDEFIEESCLEDLAAEKNLPALLTRAINEDEGDGVAGHYRPRLKVRKNPSGSKPH